MYQNNNKAWYHVYILVAAALLDFSIFHVPYCVIIFWLIWLFVFFLAHPFDIYAKLGDASINTAQLLQLSDNKTRMLLGLFEPHCLIKNVCLIDKACRAAPLFRLSTGPSEGTTERRDVAVFLVARWSHQRACREEIMADRRKLQGGNFAHKIRQ